MATPPPPIAPPKTRLYEKPAFWLSCIAGSMVAAFLVVIAIAFYRLSPNFRDLPEPPDDSALVLEFENIPDDENAFTFFVKAVNSSFIRKEHFLRYGETIGRDEWDPVLAREIIESNSTVFETIKDGAKRTHSQVSRRDLADSTNQYDSSRKEDFKKLTDLYSRLLYSEGREKEALSFHIDQAQLGNALTRSKGDLSIYFLGLGIQEDGIRGIMEHVIEFALNEQEYEEIADILREFHDEGDALGDTLKAEYAISVADLDRDNRYAPSDDGDDRPENRPFGFFYHPNRTRTVVVDHFLRTLQSVGKPFSQTDVPDLDELFDDTTSGIGNIYGANFFGEIMTIAMLPLVTYSPQSKCRENTRLSAAQCILALKMHESSHGAVPEALDALVPEYLPSIPLDDFDGEPMRYDPRQKIVYSVGNNLIDDGGDTSEDLVWRLDALAADPP